MSRRAFVAGAALGVVGSYIAMNATRQIFRSSPENLYGCRSNCYWIESTGMEDAPLLGPLRSDLVADLVIVGGGYTGLATAFYLTERIPGKKVVILEGARVGFGASGRNDGMVLPFVHGSEAIIDRLIEEGRIDQAREIFQKNSAGIDLIVDLVSKHDIDCEWEPCHCLLAAVTKSQTALLEKEYLRYSALGVNSQLLTETEQQRRISVAGYKGAVTVPVGGMLNPAKLARGMLPLLQARGVSIYEDSRVVEILPGKKVAVRTPAGSVSAPALVLATNAYTSKLGFFRNRIVPIHAFTLATEPLSGKQLEALSWQHREPFYDVRNFFELFRLTADNRIVFSGGEAYYYYQDGLGEDSNHSDYKRLRHALFEKFPALEGLAVTHQWCGHFALTVDRLPMVGTTGSSNNIYYAMGYSGHGVPVSFLAARLICGLYAGDPVDPAYDFFVNHRAPAVPPEPFKSIGFALYKRYLHWRDSR